MLLIMEYLKDDGADYYLYNIIGKSEYEGLLDDVINTIQTAEYIDINIFPKEVQEILKDIEYDNNFELVDAIISNISEAYLIGQFKSCKPELTEINDNMGLIEFISIQDDVIAEADVDIEDNNPVVFKSDEFEY